MTIHTEHPFASPEPDRDQARRLRGRLGGAVTLWTAGDRDGGVSGGAGPDGRAGLTVSSVLVAQGEPPRIAALIDPDGHLADVLARTARSVVHLLSWHHRGLAEAFAGAAPAPGGLFGTAEFEQTAYGPRLLGADTFALASVESTVPMGWSLLVTCFLDEIVVGEGDQPLEHRRGRYVAPTSP